MKFGNNTFKKGDALGCLPIMLRKKGGKKRKSTDSIISQALALEGKEVLNLE